MAVVGVGSPPNTLFMRRIAFRQPPSLGFWAPGVATLDAISGRARLAGSARGSTRYVRCGPSSKAASGLIRGDEAEMCVSASENESTEAEGEAIGEARGEPEREDE